MPENEPKKQPSIFFAIPCGTERDGWIHPGILSFLMATMPRRPSMVVHLSLDARPVDFARRKICDAFLRGDAEWLAMLDNDVVPSLSLCEILDSAPSDAAVIVPKVHLPVGGFHPAALGWIPAGETDSNGWQPLGQAITASIFIRRKTFSKIARPFFQVGINPDGSPRAEDETFCEKVRAAGLKIYGNRFFSCSHFRTLDLNLISDKMPEFNGSHIIAEKNKMAAGR